ncbi:aminotransferase V [Rhizocola hellebori]|uniref:Aminotransferase V n=1 Tax=Rhizocola hellebori TaxID=1392758 RepID=A0A8J3QK00_9ACTN|nr:GNAT family N-acetyltransferase [Rhizocola hellebori]GIH11149.1 aminotransferase V [Rhizocola hellebori]
MPRTLEYRIANTETEFEAIHRLNYRTFVEEIPQHAANDEGRLVDRFHAENTYAVCYDGDHLVGMLAGRSARPFSLDGKLADLDKHLPQGRRPVEIRLLAVEPSHRNSVVIAQLITLLARHFAEQGCDLAVISGTTRALAMYRRLGFVPFGPLTGVPGAQYQPMYLDSAAVARWAWTDIGKPTEIENFLPGPVSVAPEVAAAFAGPAAYHRSPEYLAALETLHADLAALVHAQGCQLLMGSGTLANDVVAAQLSRLDEPGVIVAQGEFGERLIDHAGRMGLTFKTAQDFDGLPQAKWLWTTHCETSTGTLTDLPALVKRCDESGTRLVLDCISSIGTVPLDLSGVYLATGASGKALGSYPGLSMVFYQRRPTASPGRLPRYLDLGSYVDADGVAFTQSSNLVQALRAALAVTDWPDRYARLASASTWLHHRLRRLGFDVVAPLEHAAPGVCTIALESDAAEVGRRMEAEGYLLAYQSGYLRTRNWLQVSLMGQWSWPALRALPPTLRRVTTGPL